MIGSLDDYVSFLCKHNMSGDQFLFCCLIYERKFNLLYKILNERNGFDIDELSDLEDRGYLLNKNRDGEFQTDMYEITDKFLNEIYRNEDVMWKEVIDTYPMWIYIEGKRVSAQSTDLDALKEVYLKKIKRAGGTHKKIVDLIEYAKSNDLIEMGIDKWVRGEQWKPIEKIKKEKPVSSNLEKEF